MKKNTLVPDLKNAPIEEAVIDVSVKSVIEADASRLDNIFDSLRTSYPERKPWNIPIITENGVETDENENVKVENGFLLSNSDESRFVHVNCKNLTFNMLRPYSGWTGFSEDFKGIFEKYASILNVDELESVSLRFINKFDLSVDNWNDYIQAKAFFATTCIYDESPISMSSTFTCYEFSSQEYDASGVLNVNIRPKSVETLEVIFDIEVKSNKQNYQFLDYSSLQLVLDKLRSFKNQIFFSNLPKAKEMFS